MQQVSTGRRPARCARGLGCIAIATGAMLARLVAGSVHAGLGTAIEFYNPALSHYFITAYPEEAAALDAGTNVKGWTRTGGQFTVFTDPAPGSVGGLPLLRHARARASTRTSTPPTPAECAKVKTLPAWTFEAIAFYIPTAGQRRLRRQLRRCIAAITPTTSRTPITASRST